MAPESWESTLGRISAAAARSGRVELLTGSGLSLRAITAILRRKAKPTERTVARLLNAIPALEAAEEEKRKPMATILEWRGRKLSGTGYGSLLESSGPIRRIWPRC